MKKGNWYALYTCLMLGPFIVIGLAIVEYMNSDWEVAIGLGLGTIWFLYAYLLIHASNKSN